MKNLCGAAFQLGIDDIVVFVVGPSGSGKSMFIEEVTRSGFTKVGTNLQPCTAKVQAVRCELTEAGKTSLGDAIQKNIVFIDTPSFHTGRNDGVGEKEMEKWLNKSRSKSTLVGTIYMQRVETDPYNESIQQHLNTFAYTFPQDFVPFPKRLHAVLSYEGVIPENTIRLRRKTFQAQLRTLRPCLGGKHKWNASFHPDLFQAGDPETAWRTVVALFTHSQPEPEGRTEATGVERQERPERSRDLPSRVDVMERG
ncbi:hypothetical protein HD554DRAFT_1158442 [Boletus coccyginus]|nr:hypothetical protein HD554DRAFT_1158442 [Boletus coccyginus]